MRPQTSALLPLWHAPLSRGAAAVALLSFTLAAASGCETAIAPPDITCIGGDFVVNRIDEVQSLRTARCVTGDLVLAVEGIESIEAPYLESVDGDLVVVSTKAPSLILPALQTVGGDLMVQANSQLLVASFGALTDVGRHVVVNGNPLLGTLSLPTLEQTGGDLTVGGNSGLANVDLAVLERTGGSFSIVDNALLTAAFTTNLARVGGSFVLRSPALGSFSFETLQEVGRSFVVEGTPIRELDLSQLDTLDGPFRLLNTDVASVRLSQDAQVTTLELRNLPALESLAFLDGRLADEMETLQVEQLLALEDTASLGRVRDVLTLSIRDLPESDSIDLSGLERAGSIQVFRVGTHIDLSQLVTVDASAFVSARTCALNRLEDVGADLNVEMRDLNGNPTAGCALERLRTVGGRLNLYPFPEFGAPALQSVGNLTLRGQGFGTEQRALPSLETVAGQLVVQYLRSADFPRLTSVGGIFLRNITTTTLPLLENAPQFSIDSRPFVEATGTLDFRWARSLRTLSLPLLERVGGNGVYIQGLELLQTLDLSALNEAPSFTFSYTDAFDVCTLTPLLERLEANGTEPNAIYVEGYDGNCEEEP